MSDEVDLEAALDALYATPPEDFTAARNGLAKALKAAGRKDEAAEVTALRKPNRLVWALDQLALGGDPSLPPLLEAVDVVRDGGGDDLKAAVAGLREAVAVAARAAAGRLDPKRPTDRPELAAALNAVVADADGAGLLAAGRLLEVPAPDAFGLGPSLPAPAPKKRPPAKAKVSTKAAEAPPVDQLAVRRAEKRRREAAKADDSAQRALARAQKALDAEAVALEQADADRAEAAEAVTAAEAALAAAQAELERAESAGTAAAESRERAASDLSEAQERADTAAAELADATKELDAVT